MDTSPTRVTQRGNIGLAALVMLILPLVLFFIPGVGSFIGGIIGGRIAGTTGRGALASILPTLLVIGLLLVAILLGPLGFIIIAIGVPLVVVLAFVHGVAGFIGALIGGYWQQRIDRAHGVSIFPR